VDDGELPWAHWAHWAGWERDGSDLGVLGEWCEPREVCESRERRVLSELRESSGLRDHGDDSYPGEQHCQHGHGKPRVSDGKVEQGVEGAQEHKDTLLESTLELNLPNRVIWMKFVRVGGLL